MPKRAYECPFCGSNRVELQIPYGREPTYRGHETKCYLWCRQCHAQSEELWGMDVRKMNESLCAKWNVRSGGADNPDGRGLKPCPCCGDNAALRATPTSVTGSYCRRLEQHPIAQVPELAFILDGTHHTVAIACPSCGVQTEPLHPSYGKKAEMHNVLQSIKAWNHRTPLKDIPAWIRLANEADSFEERGSLMYAGMLNAVTQALEPQYAIDAQIAEKPKGSGRPRGQATWADIVLSAQKQLDQ